MAVPLGLELDGLNTYTLADGSQHQWPTATAQVEFGSHAREISIALAYYGGDILVGMNFLEEFDLSLVIHQGRVFLVDEEDFDLGVYLADE